MRIALHQIAVCYVTRPRARGVFNAHARARPPSWTAIVTFSYAHFMIYICFVWFEFGKKHSE